MTAQTTVVRACKGTLQRGKETFSSSLISPHHRKSMKMNPDLERSEMGAERRV